MADAEDQDSHRVWSTTRKRKSQLIAESCLIHPHFLLDGDVSDEASARTGTNRGWSCEGRAKIYGLWGAGGLLWDDDSWPKKSLHWTTVTSQNAVSPGWCALLRQRTWSGKKASTVQRKTNGQQIDCKSTGVNVGLGRRPRSELQYDGVPRI